MEEFDEIFENLEEIFAKFFNSTEIKKNKTEICKITKMQTKKGIKRKIKISTADICNECRGKVGSVKCKKCYDRGFYFTEKEIELTIPPKTKNNDIIILKEKGNKLKQNEERGDLYIRIHIYGDKSKRKGKRIYE